MSVSARVIIVSGPSGAGKTTLHDLLLKSRVFKGRVIRSISATTRKPRGRERHGREYLFLSHRMFEHKVRTGQFLEWMKVFDNYYGTPVQPVRAALKKGKNVLLCIDVKGGLLVKKKMPDALMIFVRTPTLKALRDRLEGRGTDSRESVVLRLQAARQELKKAACYDHVIVNDRLDVAFRQLVALLKRELPKAGV